MVKCTRQQERFFGHGVVRSLIARAVFGLRLVQALAEVLPEPAVYFRKLPGPFGHPLTHWPGFFMPGRFGATVCQSG